MSAFFPPHPTRRDAWRRPSSRASSDRSALGWRSPEADRACGDSWPESTLGGRPPEVDRACGNSGQALQRRLASGPDLCKGPAGARTAESSGGTGQAGRGGSCRAARGGSPRRTRGGSRAASGGSSWPGCRAPGHSCRPFPSLQLVKRGPAVCKIEADFNNGAGSQWCFREGRARARGLLVVGRCGP